MNHAGSSRPDGTSSQPGGALGGLNELRPGDSSERVYDEWATSYDADLVDRFGYNSPGLVARTLRELGLDPTAPIVDHACGTGLSGEALVNAGFTTIDGVDVSQGMLDIAASKGVYRSLIRADLSDPEVTLPAAPYAAATVVGALAPGHLEPEHLTPLIELVAPGGPIIVYFNAANDREHHYPERLDALVDAGHWVIEHRELTNYMDALDRPGWLLVARRSD